MTEKLLEKLAEDSMERLRWTVCRRLGIWPGSWTCRLMSGRRVLKYACHMALDARESRGVHGTARESGTADGFDMERFSALKGERL